MNEEVVHSPDREARKRVGTLKLYEMAARYRDSMTTKEEREQVESDFRMASMASGLPIVVTNKGSLVTPLDVLSQIKETFEPDEDQEITHAMVIQILRGHGRGGISLKESLAMQDQANDLLDKIGSMEPE